MRKDVFIVIVCAAAIFADVAISGAVVPNVPVFADRFNAHELSLGLATSAFSVVFLAAVIPFGVAVDRTGRSDLVLGIAMASAAAAAVLFAFGNALWTYAAAQGFHGLGSAGAWVGGPPVAARIAERRPRGGRAVNSVTVALGLGLLLGPLLGSLSPAWLPFLILGAIALTVGLAALYSLAGITAEPELLTGMYRRLLQNPAILAAGALILLLYAAIGMLEILFPLYADGQGISKPAIGLLFLLYAAFITAGEPVTGALLARMRRGSLETAALLVMAASLPALVLTDGYGWWIGAFIVLGMATAILVSGSMLTIAAESPPSARGGAFAFWNMAFAVGFLLGPPVGGALSQLAGNGLSPDRFRVPFFSFAVLLILASPLVWLALRPGSAAHLNSSTRRQP
ncbi:MAG: hypothetical protein Kow00129_09480 [Thermoleophilia bacterium]